MEGMSIVKRSAFLFCWNRDRQPIEIIGLSAEEKREGRGENVFYCRNDESASREHSKNT